MDNRLGNYSNSAFFYHRCRRYGGGQTFWGMSNKELQHKADVFFKDAQHWQAEYERANEALGQLQAAYNDLYKVFEEVLVEKFVLSEDRDRRRKRAGVPTKGEE
jgi:hypothetical protein